MDPNAVNQLHGNDVIVLIENHNRGVFSGVCHGIYTVLPVVPNR